VNNNNSWNEEGIKRAQKMLSEASGSGSSYIAHVYLHWQHNQKGGLMNYRWVVVVAQADPFYGH
jgi:hypothetical protein